MADPVAHSGGAPRRAGAGEEPSGPAAPGPRWPAWYAPVGFLTAAFLTIVGGIVVAGITQLAGLHGNRAAVAVLQTLVQDGALVVSAVALAAHTARPRLWHFGLGRAPLGPLLRSAALGYLAFIVVGQIYQLVFDPEGEQRIVQRLGADDSLAALAAVGVLVIVIAPVVEELFFRGFFYRALRSRLSFGVAALIDGAVFGVVHFTGAETLSILPMFVVLGVIFCWVYERTGSLYPSIAMHAFNNALAYAWMTRLSDAVPAAIGAVAVASILAAARLAPPAAASG
jgi:membrane protease YdiL (CAAX protease family)